LFRKAASGRKIPVIARTLKKKYNHRGPMVGIVYTNKKTSPDIPVILRNKADGRKDLTVG
jgi:hypothetical protein